MKLKHKQGFTLNELLVTMAIMSIMIGVALVYVGDKKAETVDAQAREFAAALRDVQDRALNGIKVGSDPSCGYGLRSGGTAWHTYAVLLKPGWKDCKANDPPDFSDDSSAHTPAVVTKNLPGGVSLSAKIGNTVIRDVAFDVPFAHVFAYDAGGTERSGTVQFAFTLNGQSRYVCLSESGLVTENGENPC